MDRESANGHRCAWQDADASSCKKDGIGNGSRRVVMEVGWLTVVCSFGDILVISGEGKKDKGAVGVYVIENTVFKE